MSLFDRFEVPANTLCPGCNEQVEELQTKAFPGAYLRTICLRCELPDRDEFKISEGRVEAYEYCKRCRYWLEYEAVIRNGRYVGVELISAEAPYASESAHSGPVPRITTNCERCGGTGSIECKKCNSIHSCHDCCDQALEQIRSRSWGAKAEPAHPAPEEEP